MIKNKIKLKNNPPSLFLTVDVDHKWPQESICYGGKHICFKGFLSDDWIDFHKLILNP